jgi:uncharacterized protein (TIGR02453 family)
MPGTASFHGFPPEAAQFLLELRFNNNRAWFSQHKPQLEEWIMAPARAFVDRMAPALQEIAPQGAPLSAEDSRLSYSIMRMPRDTRFTQDKTPYKTHLAIFFWQGQRTKFENPGYYFHFEPPSFLLAAGIFEFSKPLLEAYRKAVDDKQTGAELTAILQTMLEDRSLKLGGQHYQRVPRGYDPAHPRADLLKHNGLYISAEMDVPEAFYSADLVEFCLEKYRRMNMLHGWLMEMLGRIEE